MIFTIYRIFLILTNNNIRNIMVYNDFSQIVEKLAVKIKVKKLNRKTLGKCS